MEDIIAHNRQDILSLGLLLDKLLQVYAAPEKQTSVQDLFSLGKVLERQGESAERGLFTGSARRPGGQFPWPLCGKRPWRGRPICALPG